MSSAPSSAQSTASPLSSNPSAATITGRTPLAASHSFWSGPVFDSDDDLSDAPESPILPPSPSQTSSNHPHTPSPSDSSSELSDAPENPIWPESPKAQPKPPRCREKDCPVGKTGRRHYQGRYLHNDKPPRTNETIFSDSNPPPHIWKSWKKIQTKDSRSTVDDDWNVLGFLRWHVDDPNTSSMYIRRSGSV